MEWVSSAPKTLSSFANCLLCPWVKPSQWWGRNQLPSRALSLKRHLRSRSFLSPYCPPHSPSKFKYENKYYLFQNLMSCLTLYGKPGQLPFNSVYNRIHYNQRCCLHWMRYSAARQIPDSKLMPRSIMTC